MESTTWRRGFAGAVTTTAVLAVPLARENRTMKQAGGKDIVGLQQAGSAAAVEALFAAWGDPGRAAARRSLRLDFAFAPAYAASLALLIQRTNRRYAARDLPARAAVALPVLAAVCDAAEGVAHLRLLDGEVTDRIARHGHRAAIAKFALLGLSIAHLVARPALARRRP